MTAGPGRRAYASPLRAAAAAATRRQILIASRNVFLARGWSGATLALIAAEAGVSPKTVQAQFGTKAKLLAGTVDFALRGDASQADRADFATREDAGESGEADRAGGGHVTAQEIRQALTAREALALHAAMVTRIGIRTAHLAWVVESGVTAEPALEPLWERMRKSLRFAVTWATETVLKKPGLRDGLTLEAVVTVFEVAMAWSTYRTLASGRGLSQEQIEAWLGELYERMLLA